MIHNFYDWDDTIVLSRPAIYSSYSHALKEISGIILPWGKFNEKLYANANAFMAQLGFTEKTMREVKRLKNEVYLNKHWEEIIVLKTEKDFNPSEKHYIVSNTTSDVISNLLDKFNMSVIFSEIIGSDIYLGVNRKPAPDLYNYAFSKIKSNFNIDEDWIIIHEDSIFGLQSALAFYEENKSQIKNFKINYIPQNFN
jgi:beta-phosphoglucomutase-like phosphatase (HAD superfamily)